MKKSKWSDLRDGEVQVAFWEFSDYKKKLNKLLKPHGVQLKMRTSVYWGDLVAVSAEKISTE